MPKISSNRLYIETGHLEQYFIIDINYDSEFLFYSKIPDHLNDQFEQLSEADLDKFSACKKYKHRYSTSGPHTNIVKGESEQKALKSAKVLIETLSALTLKKEEVIVIRFTNEGNDYSHYQEDLKRVGLSLSVSYCSKLSTGAETVNYWKYKKDKFLGRDGITRSQITVTNEDIVIADTPENRKFIDDLHSALSLLVTKFQEFTATPETVLLAIHNRQKLLN